MTEDRGWWLWRLLFPARCVGCNRRGRWLCNNCCERLPYLPKTICYRCCAPSQGGRLCRRCQRRPSPLASVRAACAFEGPVRTAIHLFKYRGMTALAPLLSGLVVEALERHPAEADLVVPVPLFRDRLRQRGYNQAILLAEDLARRLGWPVSADTLVRVRATTPQVGLTAAQRRANLHGAFACPQPAEVASRRILLVDDVTTTGATLSACAETLAQAGAARVMGAVVAKEL